MKNSIPGLLRVRWAALLLLALFPLAVAACDSGSPAPQTPAPQGTPVGYGMKRLNITRDDYKAALARWESQGATEYEMVVNYSTKPYAGTWDLHVKDTVVQTATLLVNGTPATPTALIENDQLQFLTVESQFAGVETLVSAGADQFEYGKGAGAVPLSYSVAFDPTLGYPSSVKKTANAGPGTVVPDILNASTVVQSLKVIKRATPTPP